MKPAFDAYSRSTLLLKANIMAPVFLLIKVVFDGDRIPIPADLKPAAMHICTALALFLLDVGFNSLYFKFKKYEVKKRIKAIDGEIADLLACLRDNTCQKFARKVNAKVAELKVEKVNLISR